MARKSIKRENGSGSVYKRSDLKRRPWVAVAPAKLGLDSNDKLRASRAVIGHYATAAGGKGGPCRISAKPNRKNQHYP